MAESPSFESLTPEGALNKAVNRLGGQSATARLLDVRQSTVWEWINGPNRQLPAEHVLKIEAATGVSRHDLRPDIYPRGLQDGVPFSTEEGAAAMGDLGAGSSPEWPLPANADADAENGASGFQASAAR